MDLKRFLLLSFCFVYAFGEDIYDNPETVVVKKEKSASFTLELKKNDLLYSCIIKFPNDNIYKIIPIHNVTDPNVKPKSEDCGFKIEKTTLAYVGEYEVVAKIIRSTKDITIYHPLTITIEEKIDMIPDSAKPYLGQDLEFSLVEKVENFKSCQITDPNKSNYTSHESNCLFRINNINKNQSGTWKIKAIGDITFYSEACVEVKDIPKVEQNVKITLGAPAKLVMGPEKSIYCKAIHPNGNVVAENSGQCVVNITKTSRDDSGIWKVNAGLIGSMNTFPYDYNVTVTESGDLNNGIVSVYTEVPDDNSYARFECKLSTKSMDSCRMVRNDGEVFIFNEGYAFAHYKHFTTKNEKETVSCGIHIESPKPLDLKPWKCIIVHNKGEQSGSVVDLTEDSTTDGNQPQINGTASTAVNVTINEPIELMCSHSAPISYCWFKSPNGSFYSVIPGSDSAAEHEYIGDGFKMGHCGIKLKSANKIHSGTWKCGMESAQMADITFSMKVNVYETPLHFDYSHYLINDGNAITCRTFDKIPLEYCRFIRPDDFGIDVKKATGRYSNTGTDLNNGICRLSLLQPNQDDVGIWRCYGKPQNKNVEYFDTTQVDRHLIVDTSNPFFITMIVVSCGAIIAGFIMIMVTAFKFYKQKQIEEQESRRPEDVKIGLN